eukprot:2978515-Amphidinium_carterae.1
MSSVVSPAGWDTSRNVLPERPDFGLFAFLRESWAFKEHVLRVQRFFIAHPCSSVVHPKSSTGGIENRSRGVIVLACQGSHGLDSGPIEAPLNALKVRPTTGHHRHDLAMAC